MSRVACVGLGEQSTLDATAARPTGVSCHAFSGVMPPMGKIGNLHERSATQAETELLPVFSPLVVVVKMGPKPK